MKVKYQAKKTKSSGRKGLPTRSKQKLQKKLLSNSRRFLEGPVKNSDSIVGLGGPMKYIFQQILYKFIDLISKKEDKKSFFGGVNKIFTILLI